MLVPPNRPQVSRAQALQILAAHDMDFERDPLAIIGVRGYFRDTMGAPGRNDRAIYDDGFVLITDQEFATFNGNTDPSRVRRGSGFGAGKGMAVLEPGRYRGVYKFDIHGGSRPHPAICQRLGPVKVKRDGVVRDYEHVGGFGINLHCGGNSGTSSEGCQTWVPQQWPGFIQLAEREARRLRGADWRIAPTYLLIEGPLG